jgi:hypothetical protein
MLNFAFKGSRDMRRTDLTEATMQGWARLDAAQRQKFFSSSSWRRRCGSISSLCARAFDVGSRAHRSPLRSIRPA